MMKSSMLPSLLFGTVLLAKATLAAETLCSLPPITYAGAKTAYPESAFALDHLESFGIATWYSDRYVNGNSTQTAMDLVASCPESSRLSVVVYGLPNKDCHGGFSMGNNSVQNGEDYKEFISNLTTIVGHRKILYILEPDAVGLIADNGCAVDFGYQSNLTNAISILGENPNAEIYLDVGYWTLREPASAKIVAEIVKELARTGRVKGIALNTSNYRSTAEIAELCTTFQKAAGSEDMHCIADSSRNLQQFANATSYEWCNVEKAGIGAPPTNVTDYDNIDYLVYVKPPGDSDGQCVNHTAASLHGPQAGEFFNDHFVKLWNQGYFVNTEHMPRIGDDIAQKSGDVVLQGHVSAAV